jgi:hypothetical protein
MIPRRLIVLALSVAILTIACSALRSGSANTNDSSSAGEIDLSGETEIQLDDLRDARLDATLALRSVTMTLQTDVPGQEPLGIQVSFDAAGNQYLSTIMPEDPDSAVTSESPDWNILELYIVDGAAYVRTGRTGSAESTPDQADYWRSTLYGPLGPGMWLLLLPEEDFTPAGKETRGGFDTTKYTVDGRLDAGAIRGLFWVDGDTGALVAAEFSLDESLFHPVEEDSGGKAQIAFSVEKADIPAIALP